MSVRATVLFSQPRQALWPQLADMLRHSVDTRICAGFATRDGLESLEGAISTNPSALGAFVVGAATYGAFEAFDKLLALGVPKENLRVHLGHTRPTGGRSNPFARYHPMLHSKIYYTEQADGTASAIIGSHNATGFALRGLNGEAAVHLFGAKSDPEFGKVRNHIDSAVLEAAVYEPSMRVAYASWTREFVDGLAVHEIESNRGLENKRTVILLCQATAGLPQSGEHLYFELDRDIGEVSTIRDDVHVFAFEVLPSSPHAALNRLHEAKASYQCEISVIGMDQAISEMHADWHLTGGSRNKLVPTPAPFRPHPGTNMQQVRARVGSKVSKTYKYDFGLSSNKWDPILGAGGAIEDSEKRLSQRQPATTIDTWQRVIGLKPRNANDGRYALALKKMSPEAGAYALLSTRRSASNS